MTKPLCPKCGKPVVKGGNNKGRQRYKCVSKNKLCWHGTQPIGANESFGIDQAATKARLRTLKSQKKPIRRYVVTAAQNATRIHDPFFLSLKSYCEANDAELIVIPYRYKNPTSMWSKDAQDDDWWAPELVPFLLDKRINLNKHLVVLADIKTQPTASSPLQGFETLTGPMSAIIGHPKLELTTVPTPQQRLPKILTTTGAITRPNYIPSKAGKKGEHHHTFGATVVEIDGGTFHIRQINAVKDGSFIDLDREYRPDGVIEQVEAEALVMGDSHVEFIDPNVVKATFGDGGMVNVLRPKLLAWHDIHDFFSRNHHHIGDPFIEYAKHHAGRTSVEKDLIATFEFVDKHSPDWAINVFVPSNHPDALARWVRETDPRKDPENCVFWARTFEAMCLGTTMTSNGASTIDPFVYWAKRNLKCADRCVFLHRDQSFQVKGIELGYHGDRGPNGARGTRAAFGKIGTKTVIGHSHSPGIRDGVYQVGTSSRLRLGYNSGPSGWLHAHCCVYRNSKRTLLIVVNGKWRA